MQKRSKFPLIITLAVLAFFYLPLICLVVQSFNGASFGGPWAGFSLRWYQRLFHERAVWNALTNSLIIGISATLASTVLGTIAAFALYRYHGWLQKVHKGLMYAPLVMPDILMGMSLLILFVAINFPLGLVTIFLAHTTFCLSYVTMVVLGRLQNFDYSTVEAAKDLGAGTWAVIWRVLIPALSPAIITGGLLAFTLSIDDFVITFFVAGAGSTTLPLYVYSMIKFGAPPMINALSTLLLLITFAVVAIAQRIIREFSKR